MNEVKERELFVNPYIIQIDKFADSLKHLSDTFLGLEEHHDVFTGEEMEDIFVRVTERVCVNCEKREWCLDENRLHTRQMIYELLSTVEEYGAEMNVECKRKLQKKCIMAPRFLRETLEVFGEEKQRLLWNRRMIQNREGCAVQMTAFADMVQHAARELGAGICMDEHMEKKVKGQLKKIGVKLLSSVFFVTKQGRYEVHLTMRANKGQCVPSKEAADILSDCLGRKMTLVKGERPVISEEYGTTVYMEGPKFQVIQGVAKIGKALDKVSGDTFMMTELPGGGAGIVLSDGMGSGEKAFKESAMVVEMLEELLVAGFPAKTAIQMMNTALVSGREDVRFSTVDMCLFDLYQGTCEFIKAGASTTFIRRDGHVEQIRSSTLPIGVLPDIETQHTVRELSDGDFVILVTDGVLDALPVGEQEAMLAALIGGNDICNPSELANHILTQVMELSGETPMDDMTVIAAGIWQL